MQLIIRINPETNEISLTGCVIGHCNNCHYVKVSGCFGKPTFDNFVAKIKNSSEVKVEYKETKDNDLSKMP
jgi:hypothetical protein